MGSIIEGFVRAVELTLTTKMARSSASNFADF